MANHRTPLELARISGQAKVHAARFRGRADPKVPPISSTPPAWMDDGQAAAWRLFCSELPWLRRSDTALLEVACVIRARVTAGNLAGAPMLTLLRQCLGQLGATPCDRSRIAPPFERVDEHEPHFVA